MGIKLFLSSSSLFFCLGVEDPGIVEGGPPKTVPFRGKGVGACPLDIVKNDF